MARIILHLDMDAFFAQVEERENPQFRGKPVVVGADPRVGRGVVSTANYEARKYGIHSALPIFRAQKLCPNAVFLPVDMGLYENVSVKIMDIAKNYSSQWEIGGLDEVYLDISFAGDYEKAYDLAKGLKAEILEKERLTCTVGIGPNKLIAKIASSRGKPNGLLAVSPDRVVAFLDPLEVEELPGVGPKTAERLKAFGIKLIKELKDLPKERLENIFGKWGRGIYDKARGIDDSPVVSFAPVKSLGREQTFAKDTRDPDIIFRAFNDIIEDIHQQFVKNSFSSKTLTVVCRFQGFETHTKAKTLERKTLDKKVLVRESKKLLLRFLLENKKPIRLVGLRVKICG